MRTRQTVKEKMAGLTGLSGSFVLFFFSTINQSINCPGSAEDGDERHDEPGQEAATESGRGQLPGHRAGT